MLEFKRNQDKCKAVSLRSKQTGEVVNYSSRSEMAKDLGVSVITVISFLNGNQRCILNQYFEIISK